ncbi:MULTISPECIES: tyrosine-type recombinase/integrase [Streptomyces violaceusniger group]|uniref:tyrosine-type recombinase/integrase n=1 Tax=Streptomyces violaceusniger group TaxID=2839105 RepID=UPI000A3757AE|nr:MULTISPECIES: tyrosine-type recombinase/integrase [Streptomyces violaceusniger group]
MQLLDLDKITLGMSGAWAGFLRDWDRTLRAGNYPETTRYNYLLAVAQLARYLGGRGSGGEEGTHDPLNVTKPQIEAFQAWMISSRSASTAVNKHKALQQFFKWLAVDEGEIDRSPMEHVKQPRTSQKLIPIVQAEDTSKILAACRGKTFLQVRDEAIIRLLCNTGARLSEVGFLKVEDIDLNTDSVHYHGKGSKDRRVRFGHRTARALSRYLRARAQHNGAPLPDLWLADRGGRPLAPNGIKIMVRRRGLAAGLTGIHAHRWRHAFAHAWKRAGGDSGDLMLLMGWTSDDMPRHYGASAAAERAQETHLRMGIGDDV